MSRWSAWMSRFAVRRQHLLVACFPRSGSTYLQKLLQRLTRLDASYVSEVGPQNEQDLSARKLRRLRRRCVLQQHVRGTTTNVELMVRHGIRPIVQTRSLFDVVVSLDDYFNEDHRRLSCGYVCEEYLRTARNERFDYLIHLHLPWYFNFLMSWREAAERIETCPVTYEELFADQTGTLARIAEFYDLRVSPSQIEEAIRGAAGSDTRLNVGKTGRGAELLTWQQKQAIFRMAGLCRIALSSTGSAAPEQVRLHRLAA